MTRICLAHLAFAFIALGAPAGRQVEGLAVKVRGLSFKSTDVREALRSVFRQSRSVSYTISPDIHGTVTADLTGYTVGQAIQILLAQVDGTYRLEGGVVNVIQLDLDDPSGRFLFEPKEPEPVTLVADSGYLFIFRPTRVVKVRQSDHEIVGFSYLDTTETEPPKPQLPVAALDPTRIIEKLDFEKRDAASAIREVFKTLGGMYVIDPGLRGSVTLHLSHVTAGKAVLCLLPQVGALGYVSEGVIHVGIPRIKIAGPDPAYVQLVEQKSSTPAPIVIPSGANWDVVLGSELLKIRMSDLKILSRERLP